MTAVIVARDDGVCHLCGRPGATSADHVIALADGGSNFPGNLRAAHPHCNYVKNARRSSELGGHPQPVRRAREYPGAIDLHATPS